VVLIMKKKNDKFFFPLVAVMFLLIVGVGCKKNSPGSLGTADGLDARVAPPSELPSVITSAAGSIGANSAIAGGNITSNGRGMITSRGVCVSRSLNPTILNVATNDGAGTGVFTSHIAGLAPGEKYHLRAYATNATGTSYGADLTFTTSGRNSETGGISSETGDSVFIGNQVWMLKNLDIIHFQNGDGIPEVEDPAQWANLTTGAWCYYNNDPANGAVYGKLYNSYAVDDPRGLAPAGWHVATDSDWTALSNFLGGDSVAGGKIKEAGTMDWLSPNVAATNVSGFTALPSGFRKSDGSFLDLGYGADWWIFPIASFHATGSPGIYVLSNIGRTTSNNDGFLDFIKSDANFLNSGFSIRFVRD